VYIFQALMGAVGLLTLALVIELIAPLGRVSWKSRWLGLQLTLAKALAGALLVPLLYRGWSALGVKPIELGVGFGNSILGAAAGVSFAVLTSDFLGYWHHRFLHRLFWPVHATHHSIRELSALNSYAHFAEKITQFLIMVVPLSLIQWNSPVVPAAIILAVTWTEHWIHSPTTAQLSGLRDILVTPPYHRIHHSLERQHFDKNFGILFSFWDRMFGTAFQPSAEEWPETGLAAHAEPKNIWDYVIHPITYTLNVFAKRHSGEVNPQAATVSSMRKARGPFRAG
jgi:sterol desaturase/sphingolipid hydroxylase (fatty acid hydroxylase superfamily)